MKTHDLSNGWFLNIQADGGMTIRNSNKGLRVDLNAEEAKRLAAIICWAAPKPAATV